MIPNGLWARGNEGMRTLQWVGISLAIAIMIMMSIMPSWVSGGGGKMGSVVTLASSDQNETSVCALQAGTLHPYCWGPISYSPLKPTPSVALWAITAGEEFVCGLQYDTHYPICWGNDNLLNDIPSNYSRISYSSISAGFWHVCAVRDSSATNAGSVDCWGFNGLYDRLESTHIIPMSTVTAGFYHTCALTLTEKKVVCWGDENDSQMPLRLINTQFKALFAAGYNMCGILESDNSTECWVGVDSVYTPPRRLSLLVGSKKFTCGVLKQNHRVECWTLNPTNITIKPEDHPFSYISAPYYYNSYPYQEEIFCGVREDIEVGNIYCWGTKDYPYKSYLSSFSASKGLCMAECPEDYYPAMVDEQCPNSEHKVCMACNETCPPQALPLSPQPSPFDLNQSISSAPSLAPSGLSKNNDNGSFTTIIIGVAIGTCVLILAAIFVIAVVVICRRNQHSKGDLPQTTHESYRG